VASGGINLLVNTETSGFAHAAHANHGTTVSEIALTLPDAQASFTLARALRADIYTEPHAQDELDIPAIRGVGGSMLRFLDPGADLWHVDFRTEERAATASAGLTRVDHVGQTAAYDEMLSWGLFYTAIFDCEKAPIVDVADPDGLVRSQAIGSGGAARDAERGRGPRLHTLSLPRGAG